MPRVLARWLGRDQEDSSATALESLTGAINRNTMTTRKLAEAFRGLSQSMATMRPDHR